MASWLNFIKKFPNKLSPLLLGVYNESLQCGSPPETFSKSSVMLLLKKDMVLMLCSFYRPLSLQNVDAKILAKALACRIEIILTNITSMEQTGCFQYSHTFKYNIHLTVYYNPWSGGFTWCTWGVSLLYVSSQASIHSNNIQPNYFNLQCGTCQGCPLSPLLFALATEPLLIALRSFPLWQWVSCADSIFKVPLYADSYTYQIGSGSDSGIHVIILMLEQ